MVRKLVLSLIAVLGVCALAFAQNKQVSGRIVDTDGVPVIGATVMVEGTTTGTATGADGSFTISVPTNGLLNISFIGYETQTVPVGNRTHLEVVLKSDATVMAEVQVTGYGSGSKVGTVVGSAVKVKGDQLANKPVANVADALQGKVAGLQVYTSSGAPTETSSMRLHGVGSLTAGSAPLLVVDGIPVSQEMLLTLNSNDVESMTMLKDASATSIYGSRAANGVLYITLKKGRRGEQAKVVVNAQYGVSQQAPGKYEVMSTEQLANYEFNNKLIDATIRDKRIKSGINTNWRDYYYRTAPTYQADISITGGSESTAYYMAGGYQNQKGTAYGSGIQKYSFRTNVDTSVASWMRVGSAVTMGYDEREYTDEVGNSVYNPAFMSLMNRPDSSPYDDKGNPINKIDGYYNPRYMSTVRPSSARKMQVNASAYIQITPVKNLNIKSIVGVDAIWMASKGQLLASYEGSPGSGQVTRNHEDNNSVSITNTIDYNFEFSNPDHKLYLLAGQEGIRSTNTFFGVSRSGQIRDDMMSVSDGVGTISGSDSYTTSEFSSWFGRGEYSYKGKYTADATIRRDASSRFGFNRRNAIFYSFGLLWDAKKELFLYNSQTISDLSFKVSYGTQGNAALPSDYAFQDLLLKTTYNDKVGLVLGQYGNSELGWETQKLLTVAGSIGLWNRLNVEVEFYNRITEDMLMGVPQPATSGFLNRFENVGSLRNRGVDVTVNASIVRTKDWNVNFNATFSYGRSIITKLFNGYETYVIANTGLCYQIGHDAGEFYMPVRLGIDPEDGKQVWETVNKDGTKGTTKEFANATNQLLGKSRYAPYSGGFGLNASWKGITLTADFTWNYGKYMINNGRYFLEMPGYAGSFNRSTDLLNEWKNKGDITDVPKFGEEVQFDSHLLENASFLRLKNLTLAWDMPQTWFAQTKNVISGIRIYFTTRNLFTVTGYTGYDPEVDTNVALGNYPNSRQFVGGIQITF